MIVRFIVFIVLLSSISYSYGQLTLGSDTIVCEGSQVQVIRGPDSGLSDGNRVVVNDASTVSLSDDRFSGVINIGFSFSFYGIDYTQCVIGSNGMVSFNISNANTGNTWSLNGNPLPSTTPADSRNAAMLCYHDINPSQGGRIYYKTVGTAPNREFYVIYANIPMYSSGECAYQTLVLYETSNIIDFYLSHKPLSTWNSGRAIQGIQNNAGTIASIVPGRNNTQWTATNDAKRFTPTSPSNTANYTISDIPYIPIISDNVNFAWESTTGQTFPYNNGVLVVNNVREGTVGYYLTVSGNQCQSQIGSVSDTSFVTGVNSSVIAHAIDDICSAGVGKVYAEGGDGEAPFSFTWPDFGNVNTDTVHNVYSGTYTVNVVDGMGCASSTTVTVGDTPANYPFSSTLVSCPGGSDGTATVAMEPELGNLTYIWNDPAHQSTATASGLRSGTYECRIISDIGCENTVEVTVEEIPAMDFTISDIRNITCFGGNNGSFTVSGIQGGTPPYQFYYNNISFEAGRVTDLNAGTYVIKVQDDNHCVVNETIEILQPSDVDVIIEPDKLGECHPLTVNFENLTETDAQIVYTVWEFSDGYRDTVSGRASVSHEFGEGVFDVGVTIVTDSGCVYTTNYNSLIEGYPHPVADFYVNPTPALIYDPYVTAYSQAGSDITLYQWYAEDATPSYSEEENPFFTYPYEVGDYPLILIVENKYGCLDTIQKFVRIEDDVKLFVPNTFSPNDDGLNELWGVSIDGIDIYSFHLKVYNRWGEKVFESFDPEGKWDGAFGGKKVPDGVYIWKINVNSHKNDEGHEFKGVLNIIK